MKTAVVVVHGVCPHPRYEIQDAFASQLTSALNTQNYLGSHWKADILWPTISRKECTPDDVRASALRVYATDELDPENPKKPVFDIFEGYWSPIDKNQTNVASVLTWLLRSLFQPLNGYASLWASFSKTAFDLGYVLVAIGAVVAFLAGAALFANQSWTQFARLAPQHPSSVLDLLTHPLPTVFGLGVPAVAILLLALVAAYCGWTALFSIVMDFQRWIDPNKPPTPRTAWRHYFQTLLVLSAILCFWVLTAKFAVGNPQLQSIRLSAILLVCSVGALKAALALTSGFLINFLGDVQIYCTHDDNARFFDLRTKMQHAVEAVILDVLRSSATAPQHMTILRSQAFLTEEEPKEKFAPMYDKVFVAAHSLGSTIAMDAIMSIHEMAEESGIEDEAWRRLRGLITFGTALEKTRFFFDVRNPSLSASLTQWRDDVYGHLFSDSPDAVRDKNDDAGGSKGIYWVNYWYKWDIVANKIASYRSNVEVGSDPVKGQRATGDRVVCQNVRLRSRFLQRLYHIWVHGDYLGDPNYWIGSDKEDWDKQPYLGVAEVLQL